MSIKLPIVPAAFFAIVLGLSGLANVWRAAHRVWRLPEIVGEVLMASAVCVWAIVLVLFAWKWIARREAALEEAGQAIACCFISLAGVATMLVGLGVLRYAPGLGVALFVAGAVFGVGFAVWRTGLLWQGGRDPSTTTPVLYLPLGATGFVLSTGCALLGERDWAQITFGMALFGVLAIDSVVLHRLYTAAPLPPPLRPTLGIQLAPATVGAVAYLGLSSGPPDWFAHAMIGYALIQTLILARLWSWIREQPFAVSYWAFTFGITAFAYALLRMLEKGEAGSAIPLLALVLFVVANGVVALIAGGTLWLLATGRLFGVPAAPAVAR